MRTIVVLLAVALGSCTADQQVAQESVEQPAFEQAKQLGVGTVVNLRTVGEKGADPDERSKVNALGMKYIHKPSSASA